LLDDAHSVKRGGRAQIVFNRFVEGKISGSCEALASAERLDVGVLVERSEKA
jgi:hypothetical protein